jgi:hypothetical protein
MTDQFDSFDRHPDRFGHDPELRRRAEEKLKAINEAWEAIRESREGGWGPPHAEEAPPGAGRNRAWAVAFAVIALFVLVRRPTPAGLVIALILFAVAIVFARMRR